MQVLACLCAGEQQSVFLELCQPPFPGASPGVSFTWAPFAVIMTACSRGERVADLELGRCSWLVDRKP